MLDAAACHRALTARDARFDGLFFVGVTTTGVYCRPICPARTPGASRCEFFTRAAEAERAGFRACFRCRPELAPGSAAVDSIPRLVRLAAARIEAGYLNEHSADDLADCFGVTARHLRRAMERELGVTPVELAQARRLAFAKQLLHDSTLSLADVAFASGFSSIRRFNALVRERFGRPPSALRRDHGRAEKEGVVTLRLDYRPPLDWPALVTFLRGRAIAGVESVDGEEYRRVVTFGDRTGEISVSAAPARNALTARVSISLAPKSMEIAARLRALFDLDARPDVIASHLSRDPLLAPHVAGRPGLRVPGSFDPFETAVRAVLGQQVSVRAATKLAGAFVAKLGPLDPARIARASVDEVRAVGMPAARARTLIALADAVAHRRVDLFAGADPEQTLPALENIPGIGPWTSQVIAMRVLHWPDAFPAGDLGVRRALGVSSSREAEARTESWRPWRAYGVVQLWQSLSNGG